MGFAEQIHALNENFADSKVGKYFQTRERKTTLTTEIRAGIVSFLAVAYILAVNANIVKDSGGPCGPKDCTVVKTPDCVFFDPGYEKCLEEVRRSIIAATAIGSLITCFLMGAVANMPLAIAPGMGINAYFTYTVVGFRGTGKVSYQEAMAAILIESFIFWFLSLTGVRGYLIRFVPKNIMFATAGGIGLFLAHIGLQAAEGIGLVTYDGATLVTLGACPLNERIHQYSLLNETAACVLDPKTNLPTIGNGFQMSSTYSCMSKGKLRNGPFWLGVWGGILMVVLLAQRVKGAIMVGILFVTFISWIHTPENTASYLGVHSEIPGGEDRLHYWRKGVSVPDVSKTALQWDFGAFHRAELWIALITFLYVDFMDTTGTLYSMANFMDRFIPGFVNQKTKTFPGQLAAFMMDGVGIFIGSFVGVPPLTVYVESATGIKEGGRTGLTAITISFFFFLSLFFTPIFASIPPYATGPALILVGALMMENVVLIEWHKVEVAIPAFLTIAIMPLTYSIAYGVIAGLTTSIAINLLIWVCELIKSAFRGDLGQSGLLPTPGNIKAYLNEAMGKDIPMHPPISEEAAAAQKGIDDALPVSSDKVEGSV